MNLETRIDGPDDAPLTLVLGHGAGQDMDSSFMGFFAERVSSTGYRVVRFNFPYMALARLEGRRRPPDRGTVLLDAYRSLVTSLADSGPLVIGGKSLGGRIASMIADEVGAAGLVCLGYPFHPPGKPEVLRTTHLEGLSTPTLICQGERDPFGTRAEAEGYRLSSAVGFHWLADGDHGFKPRKASRRTEAQNLSEAADAVIGFLGRI